MTTRDSFGTHGTLTSGGVEYAIARLPLLEDQGFDLERLPFALRVLLENLLRREDGETVTREDIEALARWQPGGAPREIAYMPGRVLLQDFTGVPAVVDLAAMRDAMAAMGGDPGRINPLQPAELVIDHSVQVDQFGSASALAGNAAKEFERNRERYLFLRWGQNAFDNFKVVPPATGIVHQVNLEYLARGVMAGEHDGRTWAYPDTVVGTDSHTTMVNGLGVLGWGVGGIEAEAAMLGQPISMLIPEVVGMRLVGALNEGVTATDLVLTVTEALRAHGVVGKFVEFFGPGLANLSLADRATIANMAPEYGATCGLFPMDAETIEYLRFTGRPADQVQLVEDYTKAVGLFHGPDTPEATYSDTLELDLASVEASLAGPKRPQDRLVLSEVAPSFAQTLETHLERRGGADGGGGTATATGVQIELETGTATLDHGAVVIAAITSCTNTSNPSVLVAAGLVAQKANALGLKAKPWVKTSLAPGSKVVTDYLERSGLLGELEQQGFYVVGYGCTTCIGNSGPLPPAVAQGVEQGDLCVASVLSGNRNFEGRVHAAVQRQLPGLAAPGGGLRPGGPGGLRPPDRAPGGGRLGQPGLPAGRVAHQRRGGPHGARGGDLRAVPQPLRRRLPRPRRVGRPGGALGRHLRLGPRLDLRPVAALLRGHAGRARAPGGHRRRPGAGQGWGTASPPTTSRPPARSRPTARPAATCRSWAWRRRTSTPTAPGAATTR